ncbi:Gfo/Idh/MocA family oxidoreductase [Rhodovastum atsumiense]|uniref:Gfo/Idh/MocA family oxidoreductase n=1 Tax=Rhodovastum atsumiense TaxID=504468 RepID=A0A5M6IRL3_9PROT|nr:Gfo/Idh/MocA family oxidoreductase [Rhodovastum atsumiense]KAA5610926.1 Gfo/Idh/MocA family oxidoreductase [Rhodovastum atsumiense]CAH2601504.1 Gfo/Idh/MocA family oxidoreductase [Rhodovastum atsumiense]
MADRLISIGVIGAGIMGERLMRAALEHAADVVRVAGVWDPSPASLARISRELPPVPLLDSPEAVVAAADCVYVASPPASHLGHARRALAAGRALFCEKPLAVDPADARAFVAEAGAARAAVNFPFASSFAVQHLQSWIAEGVIGTPRSLGIEVAFATWPRSWQRDAAAWLDGPAQGGFTREVVSHFLFLARRLLGELVLQSGRARFPEPGLSERGLSARLTAGGVPVTLSGTVGTTVHDDHNVFTLTGSLGSVRLRDWSIAERLQAGTWHPDPDALPNARIRPLVLRRQLEGVAHLVAGEPHALATLAEAFEVQSVVEAILAEDGH